MGAAQSNAIQCGLVIDVDEPGLGVLRRHQQGARRQLTTAQPVAHTPLHHGLKPIVRRPPRDGWELARTSRVPWSAEPREEPAITPWRWIETTTRQLELCDAAAGETAVVLATDTDCAELRGIMALGLERLGCRVSEVIVRSGALLDGGDPVDNEAVASALLHADLIVDLDGSLIERSSVRDEILDEARVLAIDIDAVAQLDHLIAHPGLIKRIERGDQMVRGARQLTLTSPAGTVVEAKLTDSVGASQFGTVGDVGELAHWPSGAVWVVAQPNDITGTVIAMPGDIVAEADHVVRSPVRMTIERGRIVEVHGDTSDADLIRSYLEAQGDEDTYVITGLGWGMNLTREPPVAGLLDPAHLAPGRGQFAAGMVNIRSGDAARRDRRGLTFSLANASAMVDELDAVRDGELQGNLAPDIYEQAAST